MSYLRSLFLNFLVVFFVNRVAPGVEITYFEQIPDIGSDIFFSLFVGFLNASVFPFLLILELKPNHLKMALLTALISFGAFILISMVPFGIKVVSPIGIFFGGGIVWAMALFTNFLELKHYSRINKD